MAENAAARALVVRQSMAVIPSISSRSMIPSPSKSMYLGQDKNTSRMMNRIIVMMTHTRKASSFQERCQYFQRAKAPTAP